MTRRVSESGFTLLEVLVASMLLAMLITILTMVFSSSSIAWSTGKADVSEMDSVRQEVADAVKMADNAMPCVDRNNSSQWGYLVSPWKSNGKLRERAIETSMPGTNLKIDNMADKDNRQWAEFSPQGIVKPKGSTACIVGVWSVGPDGEENTDDDISTWPNVD